ncbi:hypothetical protein [Natrarchaeobaculum sulfurireducens]|uniref:DUF7978 domain-containing protein n=1 Tax=Natrarchaeobaculum sulfurireducens TaxID=2044521 RepID=A0A346PDJ5_9EURY|nr:hypothetical protein [Natrarchaeobaculum sulfurireducens]AXR77590.1 hypothetical protein AArc1_1251 [Natrarchaeobaculum sulfurireducens]AXR82431.1 hypothetical protein AArcMg_2439 [Natrarchaeobaculum sulfurireducens]
MAEQRRIPIPVRTGAVAGVVTWLVGYVAIYVVGLDALRAELRASGLEVLLETATDWQLAGWLFFDAHGVTLDVPTLALGGTLEGQGLLAAIGGSFVALYGLPVVALVLAGGVVTWRHRRTYTRPTDAGIAGATTVVGYLPCVVGGLVAFTVDAGEIVLRPELLVGVVLAGLAYPIVFGALGGMLVAVAGNRYDLA